MNETDKGKNNNDSNILENSMLNIDNPNYLKGKDFINRASIINNRPTRTSTVYELEGNPKNSKEVLKFIKTNKDSLGLHSISIVKEKNAEEGVEEDNKINNKDKNEENKNLKILIETYGEDADEFENKFNENKKNNNLNDLELKKVRELYAVDLGKDEKNAEVELTDYEQKVIKRLNSKKFWILKTMSKEAQVGFIDKLIKLANDKYNKQREKLFDRHSTSEYRYFLNLIFNSGCLTFDALVNLANFVSTREISPKNFTSTYEEVESCWNNYFADLGYRDISGKRDRLRVMIGPEFQARLIAHYIKLFTYLKQQNGLNEEQRKKQYQDAIQIAKSEYSKTSREFWSSFLLYVVGASFLVTLAGLVVTALLSLSGFAALAPCVVLLVATLIGTGLKFRTDYKIWPWDWVYWWKDAKGNCLKVLQSDYMKSVLINGKTDKLDKEIRQTQTKEEIEMIENKNRERPNNNTSEIIMLKSMKMAEENIPAGGNEQPDSNAKSNIKNNPGDSVITDLKQNNKAMKSKGKLYRFLFWLSMIILVVSVMIAFCPSVVATAIPLVLSVFKLDVAFTIAPLVSKIFLWIVIAAVVAAAIFHIVQSGCNDKCQQLKFDIYQKYIPQDRGKRFMDLNGDYKFYTEQELKAAGINVKAANQENIDL